MVLILFPQQKKNTITALGYKLLTTNETKSQHDQLT